MNNLYLWLVLGSFSIPFLFSFHPRLQFYKKWRSFFPAVAIMMAIFIPWDSIFTASGFWGFNDAYITGTRIFHLPIEEWLFFICIPYACIFTHYALHELFPKFSFSEKFTSIFYVLLASTLIILLWYYYDHWYTFINFIYALILLGVVYNYRKKWLMDFLPTYFIIFIPFFLVNGILTGTGIEDQVVWYNDAENMGLRLLTIPIEDTIYNLGMLLTVFVCTELFEKQYNKA
ncbi:lycopene cyclase domain-containing protein [Marixanthomonas ophiurae]|uniref:Lycopene cyclase domain-containing protein n=1 Tax=Marixanthomonas ophiurae TaxID=387659 RepID=A0A3E1QDM0_9FLAO|nr:lycopene cyclase domain-containing protein [Marixanthomonas ophiurae]RFN60207.1 lycopene cyclase domain-containing protein [Marixanthomonas ophiurae]